MNSDFNDESESSLPTRSGHYFPSSPPAVKRLAASFENPENMDIKSEPPAAQLDEASKPPLRRVSSEETERPPSAQQVRRDDASEHDDEMKEDEEEEVDSDPAEKIVDFDWNDLHERYHQAMKECHEEEEQLAQEWQSLMNVQLRVSPASWES
jgi:hypothetical protein